MKQRDIYTKSRKEAPSDEVSKSAQLLIQAGYINKEMAGVYDILPYGLKVMKKIENIIRLEMDSVGGVEMSMTALQDPELWKKTNRWSDEEVDNWFKTELKNGNELGLAFTHEEALTNLMKNHINSYKDLPVYPYQFQIKFRNELRAKSGIMRGREFLMKDLYSFSISKEQHDAFYEQMKEVYMNVFEKVGLGDVTYLTFASGGSFSKFSHEFQTVTDAGEDKIYVSKEKGIAINEEVMNAEVLGDFAIEKDELEEMKTVEVGNIFSLGTKFSEPLELIVDDEKGERVPVYMGSYGIGVGRLMGTIAEVYADEKGLVWPESVAPFKYHIVNLLDDDTAANDLYAEMQKAGVEVLLDNRDVGAGAKLGESDLIGIPYRIVVGKNFSESGKLEIVKRETGETTELTVKDFVKTLN
jgi:prolyl-tRNA synthetase